MYLDTHGLNPPRPNPFFGLYTRFITNSTSLEFEGAGLGSHKEARVAEGMKLGKAFCRWFLSEYFDIHYFAHMDEVLGTKTSKTFRSVQVERNPPGDTPDYLCATDDRKVYLAEAKGRHRQSISFTNKNFADWRSQFSCVTVKNKSGRPLSVKGYIVATRLRTEDEGTSIRSKMFVEDPSSPGEDVIDGDSQADLQQMVRAVHYSSVFDKLALPLEAVALREGLTLPADQRIAVGLWRCLLPSLKHLLFVGGLFPPPGADCWPFWLYWNPLDKLSWSPNLLAAGATFFGLEKTRFRSLLNYTREGQQFEGDATGIADFGFLPSQLELPDTVSLLRDGTLMTPGAFVRLQEVVEL